MTAKRCLTFFFVSRHVSRHATDAFPNAKPLCRVVGRDRKGCGHLVVAGCVAEDTVTTGMLPKRRSTSCMEGVALASSELTDIADTTHSPCVHKRGPPAICAACE